MNINYAIFRSEPIMTTNNLAQIGSHNQRINKDITDFNNWRSKVEKENKKQSQENVSQTKIIRGPEVKSVSFTKRSASEIQIAQQIKQRNMIIKQQKEQ